MSSVTCPFCGANTKATFVQPPEWHDTDQRQILRYDCDHVCGSMLIDMDLRLPGFDSSVREILSLATDNQLLFLSRSNRNWVDAVVYQPHVLQRLLEAQQAAASAAVLFGLQDADVIGTAGGLDHSNVLVIVETADARYTLRVHGHHAEKDTVRSEAFWLDSLIRRTSASVPNPIRGIDDQFVQTVHIDAGPRYCTAYRWIEGEMLARVSPGQRTSRAIASIGETLARIHSHNKSVELPEWFTRPSYGLERLKNKLTQPDVNADLVNAMEQLGEPEHMFGLIMHETGALSVLLNKEHASIIDFRPFGWGYYLSDVAAVRRDLLPGEEPIFLNAYAGIHPLPTGYENTLSYFDRVWRFMQ